MAVSIFLAKVIGLYLLITSITLFVHIKTFKTLLTNIKNSPALLFGSGTFALILGLLIVVSHNVWQMDWRVVITIIGWLAILKGIVRTLLPKVSSWVLTRFIKNNSAYYISASVTLIIGVYLTYFGFLS